MKDLPASSLSWVYRQNSYWEKSKRCDKVGPRKPQGANRMLRRPNGRLILLGQSEESFKSVADQR